MTLTVSCIIVPHVATREYRIVCLIHRADGHIRALGYSHGDDGGYRGTWTITEAGQAIADGHRVYIVNPGSGATAELELSEGHIRTKPTHAGRAALADLPACPRR